MILDVYQESKAENAAEKLKEKETSTRALIFIIRTWKTPFYKSKLSRLLLFSSLGIIGVAVVMPFTLLGALFEFVPPP